MKKAQVFASKLRKLRSRMAWHFDNLKFQTLLPALGLSHTLKSGIKTQLTSMADWVLFTDIFVDGEYDLPLELCLRDSAGCCRILDLGANVGFFSKRLLDLARTKFSDRGIEIACVEGMHHTFRRLKAEFPILKKNESAQLYHGLVGEKAGTARLGRHTFHAMASVDSGGHLGGELVPYLNLETITKKWRKIDLIKCDIEGSEELFIKKYADMLRRTKFAVFEFHLHRVALKQCFSMLSGSGLVHHSNLHLSKDVRLDLFCQKNFNRGL